MPVIELPYLSEQDLHTVLMSWNSDAARVQIGSHKRKITL